MVKQALEISRETREPGTCIYTLSGDLYGSSAAYDFQEEVRQKIASGVGKVILDLERVRKIDSSGIGILVATMWSASQAGSSLILAALSDRVCKVLSIAMLLDHIDHAPTLDAALALVPRAKPDSSGS